MKPYKIGDRVLFADASATVSDGVTGTREGMINGAPITNGDGTILYYCVWAERDNSREATTIIVAATNMIGTKP